MPDLKIAKDKIAEDICNVILLQEEIEVAVNRIADFMVDDGISEKDAMDAVIRGIVMGVNKKERERIG